ncbi:unnamed protein product [Rhizophagus irregularis]|nr:unnamed protein product [Rhizophagus irregularis]CAB4426512.1 unnamed protein product [Rhizophagus irregularis]
MELIPVQLAKNLVNKTQTCDHFSEKFFIGYLCPGLYQDSRISQWLTYSANSTSHPQNQRNIQQAQRADRRRLRKIQRLIQALDVRSFCRTINSRIINTRERIEVLSNLRNVLPTIFSLICPNLEGRMGKP